MSTNFLNFKAMRTIKFFTMAVVAVSMLASCSDDNEIPDPVEEEEAITKVTVTFTNQSDNTDTVVLTWDDANLDDIQDASEFDVTGEFETGEVYDAELGLFNQDEDFLDEDILADQAGIDAHFFTYATTIAGFSMARASDDYSRSDNNKLGIKTIWTANSTAGTGTITIKLFHESPTVSDDGGFGTAAGDDTDIDITFNVEIQ